MNVPLFFPPPTYVASIDVSHAIPLHTLCELAGVPCRASGRWTDRSIVVVRGSDYAVTAEPGGWGPVRIEVPCELSDLDVARHALGALAYSGASKY